MRAITFFVSMFLSVALIFGSFQLPIDGADRLVSSYGEARLSQDLKSLNFLLGLGISTRERAGVVIKSMKEGDRKSVV